MDDFRVGSVSPYDAIQRQHHDDESNRKKKRHPNPENADTEDTVSFSEELADEEPAAGYSPHHRDEGSQD